MYSEYIIRQFDEPEYIIDISYDEEDHVVTRGFIDMPGG
jgi:hypothetical protein